MRTLQTTGLYEPVGEEKISAGALSYIATRVKLRAYDLVVRELKASGITQAQLAKRLGKAPEVVSRMLSRPGNWEMKTFSELLFAISGAVPVFSLSYPVKRQENVPPVFFKTPTEFVTDRSSSPSNVHIHRNGIELNTPPTTVCLDAA
jgi:hypothetical protein